MILVKATRESEAGVLPSERLSETTDRFRDIGMSGAEKELRP
jgi:hypothetical protein